MQKHKNHIMRILPAVLLGAILMMLLSTSQLFLNFSNIMSDLLYQKPQASHSDIIIIGMDEAAVDAYGSMPWSRDILASAVEYLNSDPENRPAVIGLDTLFVGESDSEENDAYLANAAAEYDNVVVATSVTFGTQLITDSGGGFYTDDYSALVYEEPYDELLAVTEQGHVNAMIDEDGILRHAIWQIDLPDGREIPSFNQVIYKKYMDYNGLTAIQEPPMDLLHRWYLPFQSLPFGFDDGFSVTQLVNGELDPNIFAGKIVLIGPYAQGMYDEYTTAIDHAVKMFGVEYQANAIAAMLRGELKTEVLQFPQSVFIFIVMLFCLLWFYDRKILSATIMWLSISFGWLALCLIMWEIGYVLQVISVPIVATVCYIFSVATNYARAAFEKRRVISTFRRYVAPQVVSELLKDDPKALELGGKTVDIAVLFVDIRGFTTMSEKLPPTDVVDIVNRYLNLTSRCVFNNDGTLDKYVGDCTMAFWGAPIAQDDSTFKAVTAAIDMVNGAYELGKQLQNKYGHFVQFGIGIHYGSAVVGNIGSTMRMDYTAIGDTVNTAARLESVAPPGCIYVSAEVANELKDRVSFTSVGSEIKLKGKSENFEIFKVENIIL